MPDAFFLTHFCCLGDHIPRALELRYTGCHLIINRNAARVKGVNEVPATESLGNDPSENDVVCRLASRPIRNERKTK
jgi:hypothetical protein